MNWKFWKRTPKHMHEFDMWQIVKSGTNEYLQIKLIQKRRCTLCGFIEVDVTEKR